MNCNWCNGSPAENVVMQYNPNPGTLHGHLQYATVALCDPCREALTSKDPFKFAERLRNGKQERLV